VGFIPAKLRFFTAETQRRREGAKVLLLVGMKEVRGLSSSLGRDAEKALYEGAKKNAFPLRLLCVLAPPL
jgi:hypothetical protein